ncbi:hypothetical protein CC78DRAFT_553343 [Lojkania enalia]|uniref:RING-type E3 ubiquitin transferase n=1 Tax=Lojkania enalia TaxID=147567 RepID=A0A9P4KAR3_9PLEO|nr:hypothetical protein CC78DRAFT_553343 [Didymosphaeria enalia]
MFTTPAPVAPTVSATTVSPTSPSPRPSRLRGLSYLRSYTHNLHLHAAGSASGGASRAEPGAAQEPPSQTTKSNRPRAASTTPPASPSSTSIPAAPAGPSGFSSPIISASVTSTMTRTRSETAAPQLIVRNQSGPTPASTPSISGMDNGIPASNGHATDKHLPSIRFIPHQDPRAGRPSLQFPTITRTLPDESAVIRVGRYSERDNLPEIQASGPSAAAVGFKSKVVSRKHCELWCKDSQWYIKDVKSSSGTFLNHIRLSQPNVESKPFKLKDGDIIQLGIDFRGGEEMIFRCVKIRVECNRGWQQALNTFNKQTHQRLRNLAKTTKKDDDNASTHTSECSICLMSIAPCQSLFVAPCSHVWHYKCIRPILNGPTWPNFLCPNCRAVADLEADVEDPGEFEEWDDEVAEANGEKQESEPQEDRHITPRASTMGLANGDQTNASGQISLMDLENALSNVNIIDSLNGIANQPVQSANPATPPQRLISPTPSSSITQPVAINVTASNEFSGLSPLRHTEPNGLSPERAPECPMTPRNDAGPFVLDGSAGRASNLRSRDSDSATSGSTTAPILPPLQMD